MGLEEIPADKAQGCDARHKKWTKECRTPFESSNIHLYSTLPIRVIKIQQIRTETKNRPKTQKLEQSVPHLYTET